MGIKKPKLSSQHDYKFKIRGFREVPPPVIVEFKYQIGDLVSVIPQTFGEFKRRVGEIVYIHPKKEFAMLEFDLPGGKVRESFVIRNGVFMDE